MIRIHITTIALLLLLGNIASAQTMGSLAGTITDAQGKPVRFATVRILGTSPARGAITKENGSFLIEGIRAGVYNIQITEVRYTTRIQDDIHISADTTTTVNVSLSLASLHIYSDTLYGPVSTTKGRTSDIEGISGEKRTAIQGKNISTSPSTHTNVGVSCIHYDRGGRATETSMRCEDIDIIRPWHDTIEKEDLAGEYPDILIVSSGFGADYPDLVMEPDQVKKQVSVIRPELR